MSVPAEQKLANLVVAGRLVVEAAWRRTESRGAHYRSDYPDTSPSWQRHLIFRRGAGLTPGPAPSRDGAGRTMERWDKTD